MFVKLALRNVKRQLSNYLIYFITVLLTVASMFAINNIMFNQELLDRSKKMATFQVLLIALTIAVVLISGFVLGYATSYMIKLRKREFGTYLTLGMERKDILMLFISETMILCAVALAIGMVIGLFVYQIMIFLVSKAMDIAYTFAAYSLEGLIVTVIMCVIIFMLSGINSAVYLRKVTIYNLIYKTVAAKKDVKHPALWFVIAIVSLIIMIVGFFRCYACFKDMINNDGSGMGALLWGMIIAVCVFAFHACLSLSVTHILLINKSYCGRGTNTFFVRQLKDKLSGNSIMCGIIAFLIVFAILCANYSMAMKISNETLLNISNPYDVMAEENTDYGENMELDGGKDSESEADSNKESGSPIDLLEGKTIVESYADIELDIPYAIYTSGERSLYNQTKWVGEGFDGLTDSYMPVSQFNELISNLGYEPISLNSDEYYLVLSMTGIEDTFKNFDLKLDGKTYKYTGSSEDYPRFAYQYMFAVVPDEAVSGMSIETNYEAMNLANNDYDAYKLKEDLTYEVNSDIGYVFETSMFSLRQAEKMDMDTSSAVLMIGSLYISIVFVCMAVAMLALKSLTSIGDDKIRYNMLYKIGVDKDDQGCLLFKQNVVFFFLPFVIPVLLSIPIGVIFGGIFKLAGFNSLYSTMICDSLLIALIITVIYVLYFVATYVTVKRNVVN